MLNTKLLGAVSSPPAEYVEDVFSTYLYTGNGSTQTINNGIALADGVNIPAGIAMAGGFFAGIIKQGGTDYAVIVAPKATGENSSKQYKTANTSAPTATQTLNNGPAASASMNSAAYPAAQFCEDLTIGGFSDWYLPSRDELELCYRNLKPTAGDNSTSARSTSAYTYPEGNDVAGDLTGRNRNSVPAGSQYTISFPSQTVAIAFQSGGTEAFAANYYWSSTDSETDSAWRQAFDDGFQGTTTKSSNSNVRAVRRILVSNSALDPYRVTGKGGLVWIKDRNSGAKGHALFDTVRGGDYKLQSQSTTNASSVSQQITSFNSNGFTLGTNSDINSSPTLFCSWTFREKAKFFDVLTYTGTGSARTVAHNLGSVPGMIIVKRTDTGGAWQVYHRSNTAAPETDYLVLNTTAATADSDTRWNDTLPTSSVFSLGTDDTVNASAGTYVAYLFAHNAGGFGTAGTDNVISCGSFVTGSTGVETITLGYEPQYVMFKRADSTGDWIVLDNMRGFSNGSVDAYLYANTSDAETTAGYGHPTATGFVINAGFGSGQTYIYMAIRRPMKPPTSGTQVFSPSAVNVSAGTKVTTGFPVDWQINYYRGFAANYNSINSTRLTGVSSTSAESGRVLWTSKTDAEASFGLARGWDNTGFQQTSQLWPNSDNIYWNFRRATGFFDVVCWTGAGGGGTLNHNLGAVPELIIWKARNNGSASWFVYSNLLTNPLQSYVRLNASGSRSDTGTDVWTTPTTTQFGYTSYNDYGAGTTYIAYLFATLAGVSKIGTYTGNGSSQTINCGFTAGARFVLIKRTDASGDWVTLDTARGIVSGNDPFLQLNNTDAEVTGEDIVDPDNSGFIVNSTTENINASGGTYIYLAIA